MDTQEFTPVTLGLTEQKSVGSDKACTAYSLANLLKLQGEAVTPQQLALLKKKALSEEPNGLKPPQISEFLNGIGYEYQYLGEDLAAATNDKTSFLKEFLAIIKKRPLSFTISSALTHRRDSSSPTGFFDFGSKGVGHQVVARYIDGRVQIVDPYAPYSRLLSYEEADPISMNKLLPIVTSKLSQYYLEQTPIPITRDAVINEGLSRLNSENATNFIKASVENSNMYTAVKK